LCTQHRFN